MVFTAFCQTCGRTVYLGEDDARACPVCSSPLVASETTRDSRPPLDVRIAQNEDRARSFNEKLERDDLRRDADGVAEFVCECGNADCSQTIEMPIAEYEGIRRNPKRFVVALGHKVDAIEVVVEKKPSYTLVEKVGRPGEIAEDLDERG
jgi:DNA-directed RNA polymerase subunit RPC12/RpoP